MRPFRFSLQRVLELRHTQLEIEQACYKRLAAEVSALDRARAELEASGIHAEVQVRQWRPLVGTDLAALGAFRGAVRAREQSIAARRAEVIKAANAQMAVTLEAQRRCRLLQRLKERRMAEWRSEEDRGLESLATESFLARWTRERR